MTIFAFLFCLRAGSGQLLCQTARRCAQRAPVYCTFSKTRCGGGQHSYAAESDFASETKIWLRARKGFLYAKRPRFTLLHFSITIYTYFKRRRRPRPACARCAPYVAYQHTHTHTPHCGALLLLHPLPAHPLCLSKFLPLHFPHREWNSFGGISSPKQTHTHATHGMAVTSSSVDIASQKPFCSLPTTLFFAPFLWSAGRKSNHK